MVIYWVGAAKVFFEKYGPKDGTTFRGNNDFRSNTFAIVEDGYSLDILTVNITDEDVKYEVCDSASWPSWLFDHMEEFKILVAKGFDDKKKADGDTA